MPSAPIRRLAFPKTILVGRAGTILAPTPPTEEGKVRIAVDYDTAEESNNSATEAEANISVKKVLQRSTRKKETNKMKSVAEKEQTVEDKVAVEVAEAAAVPARRGPKRRKPARDPLRPRRPRSAYILFCQARRPAVREELGTGRIEQVGGGL